MSRKTARHQVAAYLSAANIAGVGTVFASPPKVATSGDAFANVPPGTPSGSVLFVEVLESREIRVAFGGPVAGKKMVTHSLRLHLLFRSRQKLAEDAMDDHDDLVEAILELLRADRTVGTLDGSQTPIFQNGEGTEGIVVQTGMPLQKGTGSVEVWSLIDSALQEFITA